MLMSAFSVRAASAVQGTVHAWGDAAYGQLGFGYDQLTPQVSLVTGANHIAAGQIHALALKADGTVWAWGANINGQLGNGLTADSSVPQQVSALSGITAIACGGFHSLALKNDGTVWTWGFNLYGQLGNGMQGDSNVPVQVSGLSGITAISGGEYFSLALKNDGAVYAWGFNDHGELGNGTITLSTTPVQVSGLTGITAIAGGDNHSLALKNDATVLAWGFNFVGQLGDNTIQTRKTPVAISGLTGVKAVAAGQGHSLALKTDGTVFAWGNNNAGELGIGTTDVGSRVPVQVHNLTGVATITSGQSHVLALKTDGSIVVWGDDFYGELGNGTSGLSNLPIPVPGLSNNIVGIAGGRSYSLVLKSDGSVVAFGLNSNGQFGGGIMSNNTIPVQTGMLSGLIAVAAGEQHSLALKSDGSVMAWGNNFYGQLGDGTTILRNTPTPVTGLSGVIAIAAGENHSVALKGDGTVWAWGQNAGGQLGNGGGDNSPVPVQVPSLSGVTAISARRAITLALKNDGTVWAFGDNLTGQFGDGTTKFGNSPVKVSKLTGATAIAVGSYFCMALRNDGSVFTWGYNGNGELGIGSTKNSKVPVQIKKLTDVSKIAAGGYHAMALKKDGSVMAWGANSSGQLGNGRTDKSTSPVRILGANNVSSIACGTFHTLAINSDGTASAWGKDDAGQLGRGFFSANGFSTTPVPVSGLHKVAFLAAGLAHSLALIDSNAGLTTVLTPSTVLEQMPVGTPVGSFFTTDPSNAATSFSYAFGTGAGDTDNAKFIIVGNQLQTAGVFSFITQPTYSILIRTTDNTSNFVDTPFTVTLLAQPNSGADGSQNVANLNGDDGSVVNPINDLAISVVRSDGGVIALQISITQGAKELVASTRFDDITGRKATVSGFNPVHKFIQKGIYVAEVTVSEKLTGLDVAMGRKMINISDEETGAVAVNTHGQQRKLIKPANTRIPTKSLKGIFFFTGAKADNVKYTGTFLLPQGFRPSDTNEFSFGIGNVIVDTTVDGKGKVTAEPNSQHAVNNSFFNNMSIKFGRLPSDGVATGTEIATFSATVLSSALSGKGFDTEGITNTFARDIVPGSFTDRNIQVSYNVAGIAYEDKASVVFVLNQLSDFGTISGRSAK